MRTAAIRVVVMVVCGLGVAGMIVASATNHNGAAITFGLITAVAVLCQMVATIVVNELTGAPGAEITAASAPRSPSTPPPSIPAVEQEASALEGQIAALVDTGADESAVRDLVRRAVRLGRGGSDAD